MTFCVCRDEIRGDDPWSRPEPFYTTHTKYQTQGSVLHMCASRHIYGPSLLWPKSTNLLHYSALVDLSPTQHNSLLRIGKHNFSSPLGILFYAGGFLSYAGGFLSYTSHIVFPARIYLAEQRNPKHRREI